MGTLGYAILGLLATDARTGFDIARLMDAPIGHMWTARHSQIYPELAALEARGMVSHEVIVGRGPRDTKRYSITPEGRDELSSWIDSPLARQPARSELLLRVRCLWLISPERARRFVAAVRREHELVLATYRNEEGGFDSESATVEDPRSAAFGEHAGLVWGISYEQHVLTWCDWMLSCLE